MNNDHCELNHDTCELSFDELEQVSGGFDFWGAVKEAASLADKVAHVLTGTN